VATQQSCARVVIVTNMDEALWRRVG
jgi:hypothetical protein